MDLCIHDCEMSGQLRASESFFSYFQVEIVGPIFLSFLKKKKISQIFRCTGCPPPPKKKKKKKKKKRVRYNICLLFISFLQKTQSNLVAVCLKTMSLINI